MSRTFPRPRLFASKCLGFAHCRWNGETIHCPVTELLREHVEFVTACPEAEIGLGVPRDPIRVVETEAGQRLLQPATGQDLTERMVEYAHSTLNGLPPIDGAILKNRSPSCGPWDVRIYQGEAKGAGHTAGAGFFGREVTARYYRLPIEDEGRLRNYAIRDHFLTRVFLQADWRALRGEPSRKGLVAFHTRHKDLFRLYDEQRKNAMGRMVAEPDGFADDGALLDAYERELGALMADPPARGPVINVLQHAMGLFKDDLKHEEKTFFLDMIEQYRQERIPLASVQAVLKTWALHFTRDELLAQSFFAPYPDTLMQVLDSGKGRKL